MECAISSQLKTNPIPTRTPFINTVETVPSSGLQFSRPTQYAVMNIDARFLYAYHFNICKHLTKHSFHDRSLDKHLLTNDRSLSLLGIDCQRAMVIGIRSYQHAILRNHAPMHIKL